MGHSLATLCTNWGLPSSHPSHLSMGVPKEETTPEPAAPCSQLHVPPHDLPLCAWSAFSELPTLPLPSRAEVRPSAWQSPGWKDLEPQVTARETVAPFPREAPLKPSQRQQCHEAHRRVRVRQGGLRSPDSPALTAPPHTGHRLRGDSSPPPGPTPQTAPGWVSGGLGTDRGQPAPPETPIVRNGPSKRVASLLPPSYLDSLVK